MNLDEIGSREAAGRYAILCDLDRAFQGAALAYAVIGVALPLLLVGSAYFGWIGATPDIPLLIAEVLFGAATAVAVYAWAWSRWVRRRCDEVLRRMEVAGAEERLQKRRSLGLN